MTVRVVCLGNVEGLTTEFRVPVGSGRSGKLRGIFLPLEACLVSAVVRSYGQEIQRIHA